MLFSLLFLTFIATTLVRITVANNFLDDPNNTNLFLDLGTDQLPSDSSSLWDADVGLGDPYTDSTFLTDSDSVALNNDQTNSFELAELGDSCEVPPSKRARRDTSPRICTPSDRQGQDQSIVNQLTIPNLLDVFKPKKKQPDRELLGDPPFGASPTGEDGNPCPVEHPLHLCCLDSEMRWAGIENVHISYFALYLCEPGKIP